ncbi:MAG TPA: NAD(P)H-binding protein [Thermoleophilaceae bacterium]|nr:NAD(P)H-binding protein [Thermoleophilaceae bacterium]
MEPSTKIAVSGATGRVGRPVVDILESRGHEVVPIARSLGVDVITGEGLDRALTGVHTIIDVATGPSPDQQAATEFFTTSTRNLQEAGRRAGVRRLVVVSIIGIEKFSGGYNAAKVAHEQAALAGPIPARIVRAAQFHEFVEELMRWGTQGDVSYVWRMRTQLVSARTVAEELVDLATAPDAEFDAAETTEVAGPREEWLVEAARLVAARRGDDLRVEEAPLDPSDPDSERYANGAALPGPGAKLAGPTFEEWLEGAMVR